MFRNVCHLLGLKYNTNYNMHRFIKLCTCLTFLFYLYSFINLDKHELSDHDQSYNNKSNEKASKKGF